MITQICLSLAPNISFSLNCGLFSNVIFFQNFPLLDRRTITWLYWFSAFNHYMPSRRDRHIVLLAIFLFLVRFSKFIYRWTRHHLLIKNSESCLSVRLSVCPSIRPSVRPSVRLSVRCNTFNKNSNNFVITQRIFMVHSSNERATHFLK